MLPLLLITLSSLLHSAAGDLRGDAAALFSLRSGLSSATRALDSWDRTNPATICSWVGIQCAGGRVVSVELANSNISGSIAGTITGLDRIVNLSLAGNAISGEIRVANLPSLRYLNISGNQFGGRLDWDFSTLPRLEVFDAYDNNFTAPLPAGVAELKTMKYLDLGGNFFYGSMPASYGTMPALEYFSVTGNDLRGRIPGELGNITSLKQLYLGYFNVFDGGIPAELGRLLNLAHLDVSSCGIAGEIPAEIGSLRSLDTLFLHTNSLSGPIPASIGNLTMLVSLDLSNNMLTGEVPPELSDLTRLVLFNLFMNRLHGSVPEFFAGLPRLEKLELFKNNFTGTIPGRLGSNGKLQTLDLSSNKLTGAIPGELCSSNQLTLLILFKNFLFGPVPESLGRCSSLVRVRLGQNYLNGSIPAGLLYLPKLNLVELDSNYISGPIPEKPIAAGGGSGSQLGQLNLSNNCLSGRIPSSISILLSLETLLLGNNRLSGSIPAAIGSLRHIGKLDFSQNNLSGPIPPEIGKCSKLTYLDLSQNSLSGEIPAEIAGVGTLNYLNLSRNRLDGAIPVSVGAMRSLTVADFSFNDLCGRLPETGQLAYLSASSFAGNPRLCGAALANPCNYSPVAAKGAAKADFKLIFAITLLVCSLLFAAAVVIKTQVALKIWRHYLYGSEEKWRMTTYHKVGFQVTQVVECMKECNMIGRGGAGVVYLGRPPGNDRIAVKRLMGLGSDSFRAEIRTLGSIRHRNIVRLLAYCTDSSTNVLVYEYMCNGSLGEVLHGKGGEFLGWDRRYRIAVEAARGLCYLHHDCSPMILHRDVKSNNILLDSGFEAHVADFGLAKFLKGGGGASESMSAIAGSYGYIAPEYAYTLKVDEKSDVYSFGVVLLEIITGKRPVGEFGDGVDIVHWAKQATKCRNEDVASIVDSRLSTVPIKEAMHVFFVAMLCIQENSVERPTMREVVQMLSEFPRPRPDEQSPSSSQHKECSPCKENCCKLFS